MQVMITKEAKNTAIKSAARHKTDVGSPEVQITVLSARIGEITEHLKLHKQDEHSRRGLLQMVGKRKRLLSYLAGRDFNAYKKIITELKLRG